MTTTPLQTQCCVCRRVRRGMRWRRIPHVDAERTTHGYCPACYHAELTRLDITLPQAASA